MKRLLNETILVYKIKRGHTDSFGPIYDHYVDKIYRFVYLKLPSAQDAEDVTAETFLKVWRYIREQRVKNLQALLYTTARNLVVDYYRKHGSVQLESIEEYSAVIADRVDLSLEEKMALKSDMAVVERALRELKDAYREIIILHYINDVPLKDIAKVVDRSPGAVRVMLHRGIKALKATLKTS